MFFFLFMVVNFSYIIQHVFFVYNYISISFAPSVSCLTPMCPRSSKPAWELEPPACGSLANPPPRSPVTFSTHRGGFVRIRGSFAPQKNLRKHAGFCKGYCWWQPEIRRKKPVDMVFLSHDLQGFKYFWNFSPRKLGKMNPFWRAYFSDGLKPPTSLGIHNNLPRLFPLYCWT